MILYKNMLLYLQKNTLFPKYDFIYLQKLSYTIIVDKTR